ncbi:hypothetical protein KRP22_013532 [Phytophthora ramorum]|nr:RxLR effector protein Avr-vnt11 [Phytophthora ramorum]
MRVYITLLVAVAALFATSEAAVDTTTKLTNIATSASIADLQTQSNGQRYLRKRETDETDNEDRAFDVKKLGSTVKSFFTSKDKKLLKLLISGANVDDLIAKNIQPGAIERVTRQAQLKLSGKDFEKFIALANEYDTIWFRVQKNLDPIKWT